MLHPSYEKYSLDELYDALSHIVKDENPENYAKLMEMIKLRQNEGDVVLSDEEIAALEEKKQYNRKMKKRSLIGLAIFVSLMITNNVITAIFAKPYDQVIDKIQNNPQLFMQIGMPFEEVKEPLISIDSVDVDGSKITQKTYEVFIKGSKSEASIFVSFNMFGETKKLVKAEMQVEGKSERVNIPLNEVPNFNRGNR